MKYASSILVTLGCVAYVIAVAAGLNHYLPPPDTKVTAAASAVP